METSFVVKEIPLGDNNFIVVDLDYDLGDEYRNRPRGYWLSIYKIKRENGMVTREFSLGVKDSVYKLLKAVKRQSKKAREEALDMAKKEYPDAVKDFFGVDVA